MDFMYAGIRATLINDYKFSEELLYVIATSTNHFFAFFKDGRPMHLICDIEGKKKVIKLEKWEYRKTCDEDVSMLLKLCTLWRIGFKDFCKNPRNLL